MCNHLIHIWEGKEWKTAFNMPLGHFEYLIMPFGLKCLQYFRPWLIMLRDMIGQFVFTYLDDILIFREYGAARCTSAPGTTAFAREKAICQGREV